jgi:hypothetical protein
VARTVFANGSHDRVDLRMVVTANNDSKSSARREVQRRRIIISDNDAPRPKFADVSAGRNKNASARHTVPKPKLE